MRISREKIRWNRFTPTEESILKILLDGESHKLEEFFKCLPDDCAGNKSNLMANAHRHISNIRPKIAPEDLVIISENNGKRNWTYRLVRTQVVRIE